MKNKKNKRFLVMAVSAAVYLLLIECLLIAESHSPDATIVSHQTAFWYSVTTLTTVGYGDTYPVTSAGRLIGFIFQLMSLGILAALFGLLLRLFQGRLLPMIRLRFLRNKTWAVFSDTGEKAAVLAGRLQAEPDTVVIFASEDDNADPELPGIRVSASVREVLEWQKGLGCRSGFCFGEDQYENRVLAQKLQDLPVDVYCRSYDEPDIIPERQKFFNEAFCRARLYWHMYPLNDPDEKIVILGEGASARELFEQALLVNIISPVQSVHYTLPGDWSDFRRNHPAMDKIASFGEKEGRGDVITFTGKPWNADWEIFREADRIIICGDDTSANTSVFADLERYCPISAKVYIYSSLASEKAVLFGSDTEIYTPELIMRRKLNLLAEAMHNSYLEKHRGSLPDWNHLSDFLRRSNLASADHLFMKALILTGENRFPDDARQKDLFTRAWEAYRHLPDEQKENCRRIEHMRWNRFHLLNNWEYAEVRDNARRRHPLIRPFDELSVQDQAKDDYSWQLLEEAVSLSE